VAPLYEQQVHPGMQAAYPNLAGAQSRIRIDPHGPELGVFEPGRISVEIPIRSLVKSKSTHELQHMIGHLDGHARCGNPLEFLKPGTSAISKTGRRSRSAQCRISSVRERTAAAAEIPCKDGRKSDTAGSTNHPF